MAKDSYFHLPLFETKTARRRKAYWLYASSVLVGICFICVYRVTHLPVEGKLGRWAWIGLFIAELWYSFFWLLTQSYRCAPIYRYPFKDRLSQRFEKVLTGIDIFVCTADPVIEPPVMVTNTILSVMAYNYPPEKLNVYLSDDGGSDLMFFALLEAAKFSKHWLPFCKKFKVEPRSPAVYFSTSNGTIIDDTREWLFIKRLYKEMARRIDDAVKLRRVSDEIRKTHKGFRECDLVSNRRDHQTILQVNSFIHSSLILTDGRDTKALDVAGERLPTLVYLAREKRLKYHHNFKAGAMNALIRVSSRISNSPFILNVDCDMFSNNADSVRNALCFLMDEERSHDIGYVQYPQSFLNITKNDLYNNSLNVIGEVWSNGLEMATSSDNSFFCGYNGGSREHSFLLQDFMVLKFELPGFDANGGPLYIGSGCFHRRDALSGKKFKKEGKVDWKKESDRQAKESADVLEVTCKILASCSYEENTQWGKEMGVKYGCPSEDVLTGFSIQCRGWKSAFFNPERKAFLGVAPTTLLQTLVQRKRWSEGQLQIFLSKYCPLVWSWKNPPKTPTFILLLYAVGCQLLGYTILRYCPIFLSSQRQQLVSNDIKPLDSTVCICHHSKEHVQFRRVCGGTYKGWLNAQRMWLYRRVAPYLFDFSETMLKSTGFDNSGFVITAKVADEDVSTRYEKEMMEFGVSSPMFNVIATLALFNLFCLAGTMKRFIMNPQAAILSDLTWQIVICGLLVLINLPLYQALFFRKDKGRMPSTIKYQLPVFSAFAYLIASYSG